MTGSIVCPHKCRKTGQTGHSVKFFNKLKNRDWISADGATGTNLFAIGLEARVAPKLWNETQPRKIYKLYRQAVEAGSNLILIKMLWIERRSIKGTKCRPSRLKAFKTSS